MSSNKYKDYRPTVFWGWNDKLGAEEIAHMIDALKDVNIGGVFPHARTGLRQEYLGDRWMEAFSDTVGKCAESGMKAWIYDEDGWPSGYAGSKVSKLGEKYQQKYLVCEEGLYPELNISKFTLAVFKRCSDGKYAFTETEKVDTDSVYMHIYYEICPYYVDIMDQDTIKEFIEVTYEAYFRKNSEEFGNKIPGAFTDEPQYSRNSVPWSNELRKIFLEMNGYDIVPKLYQMYIPQDDYLKTRYDFWKTVNFMFTENYTRQIADWCKNHNLLFTGHYIGEESFFSQMAGSCNVMEHIQYMDIPGMDWLGRDIGENPITPKQVSSVAAQFGKPRVMSEMFAASGNGATFEDLKFLLDWQILFGVNMPCYSIVPATIEGCRKRDYPPFFTPNQDSWQLFEKFNRYAEGICRIMGESQQNPRIGVVHPIRSAWALYSLGRTAINDGVACCSDEKADNDLKLLKQIDGDFSLLSNRLAEEHFDYHFIDEGILEVNGFIEANSLTVGRCRYDIVIIPNNAILNRTTVVKLLDFAAAGGKIFTFGEAPICSINSSDDELRAFGKKIVSVGTVDSLIKLLDNYADRDIYRAADAGNHMKALYCSKRYAKDGIIYFILNKSDESIHDLHILINEKGIPYKYMPIEQMKTKTNYMYTDSGIELYIDLAPRESTVIVVNHTEEACIERVGYADSCSDMLNSWEVERSSLNALVLDFCSYSIDGGRTWNDSAVIKILDLLIKKRFTGKVMLKFEFHLDETYGMEDSLYLGIENIVKHMISINGRYVKQTEIKATNIDASVQCMDIMEYVQRGRNEILLERVFLSSQRVFDVLTDPKIHETELTRLTYDVEIENIYLLGKFKLESTGVVSNYGKDCYKAEGPFKLKKMDKTIDICDITNSGYYFFNGSISMKNSFMIDNKGKGRVLLKLENVHANGFSVEINFREAGSYLCSNEVIDITELVTAGENTIVLKLYTTLRNLLGPMHHVGGDKHMICPDNYTDKKGWTDAGTEDDEVWSDNYFFTKFGIEGKIQIISCSYVQD